MSLSPVLAAVEPIVGALERLEVVYYLGGSVASSAYGVARSTIDADLVAELHSQHIDPLVESLESDYYVSASAAREAVQRQSCFNVIHLATMFKVDIFVMKTRAYDVAARERIRREDVGLAGQPAEMWLASPEDVILNKLEWFRLGDEVSERQWLDVLGVMRVRGDLLDWEYMEHWAAELGVADLLERAAAEARG